MVKQSPRPSLDLDDVIVAQIDEATRRLGVTRASLMVLAIVDCARIARHPDLAVRDQLPQLGATHPAPGSRPVDVKWTHGRKHFEDCRVAIEDAGSTVTGALRWWVSRLLAAGGDPVAMDLAPKRTYAVAA